MAPQDGRHALPRRALLAAAAGGLAAGAGCTDLAAGPDWDRALGPPVEHARPVVVTRPHYQAARSRFEAAADALTAVADGTAVRPGMYDELVDWHGGDDTLERARRLGPTWPAVELLRDRTVAAVNEATYRRAWAGRVTRADVAARVAALDPPGREQVAYDRGDPAPALVQAAATERRVRDARRYAEYAGEALAGIEYETVAAVPGTPAPTATAPVDAAEGPRKHADRVNERFAGPAAIASRHAAAVEQYGADVGFLATALPATGDHRPAFQRAVDALRQRDGLSVGGRTVAGVALRDLAGGRAPASEADRAAHAAAEGWPAIAARATLLARVLQSAVDGMTARAADSLEATDREAVLDAGAAAHETVAGVHDAAGVLGRSLLGPAAGALAAADERVRRLRDEWHPTQQTSRLRTALAHYRFAAAAGEAAPRVADRFPPAP